MRGASRRFVLISCVLLSPAGDERGAAAEPVPLFFKSRYGDARDVIANSPRKFKADDPAWQPLGEKKGEASGQTSVTVHFPTAGKGIPVRFGIPLGQVASAGNVAVFDERGRPVRADVFPLVNFVTAPQHWVLIAAVLDAPKAGDRRLTIRWGEDVDRGKQESALTVRKGKGEITVSGGQVGFRLSAEKLLADIGARGGGPRFATNGCQVGFKHNGVACHHRPGKIITLYDGALYKRFRVESTIMNDRFKLHFDVETWADSCYLLISSRLINESNEPLQLSDLEVLSILPDEGGHGVSAAGAGDASLRAHKEIAVCQRVDDWSILCNGKEAANGTEDNFGSWVSAGGKNGALTLAVPGFQGFGPGDPDLESRLHVSSTGSMGLLHYGPHPPGGDGAITFWDTAGRTFRMVLHVGVGGEEAVSAAAVAKYRPSVKLDRKMLTEQGVFFEDRVTHVYDEPSLEGARYFNRTRAHRHDYPRMGRGMPPPKGEGFEHPYTDTGGMLFGEVWQYAATKGTQVADAVKRARVPAGNIPAWYKPKSTVGISTYRCGDQSLAIAMSYLRTGDREVFEIFDDHPLQFADFSIAHPEGYCHYYCHWRADNHVYSRLGGIVLSYLMDGDPWFFEVAEQMGGHLVRAWKGNERPHDRQTRSAYPGRGLVRLYEVTGHRSYWNDAVDLACWIMQTGMQPNGAMRGFANDDSRISPLYAGYTNKNCIPTM